MNRFIPLFFFILVAFSAVGQNKDTANININGYSLHPGTFSWRGTGTFHNMTGFNSNQYGEGHLRQGSTFRMNYRLLQPVGYDPNHPGGYPMIVMLHGAGERGNCWSDNCYCDGCIPNSATPDPGADPRFMNNDHNLLHGGSPHLTAVNLAGSKKPDDPTLAARAFPGFVFFPQMMNQWRNGSNPASSDLSLAIRIIRLLVREYNIDQDRIYIHGLSMGGQATLEALNFADWLFAAAAPMSAITLQGGLEYDSVKNIPFWIFQGGKDTSPKPSQTKTMIYNLREKGANVRYTEYPHLGHGVWGTAYGEPDFFSWLLSHRKSNIHVAFSNPNICGTTGAGARLELPQGFYAYQWERDGEIIPGATQHTYVATFPGIYRARFSRKSTNPIEAEWNRWSDPVTVGEKSPEAPLVEQIGTIVLKDLNEESIARLRVPEEYVNYTWRQNGGTPNKAWVQSPSDPTVFTLNGCTGGTNPCPQNGAYTLITQGFDQCPSLPSKPLYVLFATHAVPRAITARPTNLTATVKSPTSVLFTWLDNSPDERAFELWRRKLLGTETTGADYEDGWVMAALTEEDATSFLDTGLEPGATYYYKIRAVSNKGRSDYFPGNTQGNVNHNRVVTLWQETQPPSPPTNLTAKAVAVRTIRLFWDASTDASGIKQYYIYLTPTDSVATNSNESTFTLQNLPLNTVYNFHVKAQDFAGNLSAPSNSSQAHTYVTGLYYKHTTGAWDAFSDASMVASWNDPEFEGWVPNFTLDERTQDDFFNFEFDGYLYITTPGNYHFQISSDDGHQLYINNALVFSRNTNGQTSTGTSIPLPVGAVPIRVRYFEKTGGQSLTVRYRLSSTATWTTIPASALRSGYPPDMPTPPPGPESLVATATGMQTVDLEWEDNFKVVILGAQTANGGGATPAQNSWVNLFSTWANSVRPTEVVNLAQDNLNTRDVLPTGNPARNITHALSLNPDMILVNLPTNDAAGNIPRAETVANLQTLKELANELGVLIFFTTTQPRNLNSTQRSTLQSTAADIRQAFGQYVFDIYDELTNLPPGDRRIKAQYDAGDGHNLNNNGHAYIFSVVQEKLSNCLLPLSYQVQRSLYEDGPFLAIHNTADMEFTDTGLIPDSTYYYRVIAMSADTVSRPSNVASAHTFVDNVLPTQPGTPTLHRKSFSAVSILWTASTDNIGIKGYEVFANNQYVGFANTNAFQVTGLEPGTLYNLHVIALDLNENRSAPSGSLAVTTDPYIIYRTINGATELNNLNAWRSDIDNNPPQGFDYNGQFFAIQHTLPVSGPWSVEGAVSKVIVSDNTTLTVNANPVNAKIDIPGNGTLNLINSTLPELNDLSPSSTVNYSSKFIQNAEYGNLGLITPGAYNFPAGTIKVRGNLTGGNGVSLKGASSNNTTIELSGNLVLSGTPAALANSFGINFELVGNGNHTIQTGGALELYRISKPGNGTITFTDNGSPATLNIGSSGGGGISLSSGATLNIGNNTLALLLNSSINGNGETGRIAVNEGTISITSSSSLNSNLYFTPGANTAHTLYQNMSGSGDVVVHSALDISDGIKIRRGELVSNNNLRLLSTASKTANLQEIENNGQLTGSLKVQRYVNAKARTYRYISSPVQGVTIANWQQFFAITGEFTGTSTGPGLGTQPSLYIREPEGWVPYPTTDNTAPIERGRGYAAFVRNTTPVTIEVAGVPHQGPVTFNNLFPPQGNSDDWNLLGNPYASTIEWSNDPLAWTKSDISTIVAVRNNINNSTGQFQYYDANTGLGTSNGLGTGEGGTLTDGKIAPGQAFYIQASGPSPQLTIHERAKNTEQQILYRDAAPKVSHLKVRLTSNAMTDGTLILLTDYGTDNYDPQFDGVKMDNQGIFNLASRSQNDYTLAINNLSNVFCSKSVALEITQATAGNYSLDIESPETLFGVGSIRLVDHYAGATVEVAESLHYPFTITSDPLSTGKDRFTLLFERPELQLNAHASVATSCEAYAQVNLTNTQPGASYALYKNGNTIGSAITSAGDDITFTVPADVLQEGLNEVQVQVSLKGCASAFLPGTLSITHYALPVISAHDVSICAGSSANLAVTGTGSIAAYEWYGPNGKIKGADGAQLVTENIHFEEYYYVNAVNANGCAGPRKMIRVTAEHVAEPEILFQGDTLYTTLNSDAYFWALNGQTLSGTETQNYIVASSNGSYTLTLKQGGCSKTSREHVVTGAEENPAGFTCELYPNPTSSGNINLRLRTPGHDNVVIRMVDVVGREFYSSTFTSDELHEDIVIEPRGEVNAGVYFVLVEQGLVRKHVRFVIRE